MAQPFPRWFNKLPLVAAVAGLVVARRAPPRASGTTARPKYTDVGYRPMQPVPYSHKLHAGELGIDCRYCHASVEVSAVANVPPTQACMNCHRWSSATAPLLAPIRDSADERAVRCSWMRVHKLPDYAYFTHTRARRRRRRLRHLPRPHRPDGGRDAGAAAQMSWCLDCHRNPAPEPPPGRRSHEHGVDAAEGSRGARRRKLDARASVKPPVDCSGCHR